MEELFPSSGKVPKFSATADFFPSRYVYQELPRVHLNSVDHGVKGQRELVAPYPCLTCLPPKQGSKSYIPLRSL